jgi:hypothetical protein
MQTFLPTEQLKSIQLLDPKRLGNQVYNEGYVLMEGGWPNHPAAKIWANHKKHLSLYCLYGLQELTRRGLYYPKWIKYYQEIYHKEPDNGLPSIIGNERFHSGHRAALLAKFPEWYSRYGWTEKPEPNTKLAYIWR